MDESIGRPRIVFRAPDLHGGKSWNSGMQLLDGWESLPLGPLVEEAKALAIDGMAYLARNDVETGEPDLGKLTWEIDGSGKMRSAV